VVIARNISVFLFLVGCFFQIKSFGSSDFTHSLNHYSGNEITKVFICGERCSGTNFTASLIHKNFPNLTETGEYGHKHFLWWFEISPQEELIQSMNYSTKQVHLENSDDCLFIVVVRDPYDWLRSFYLSPYHVHKKIIGKSFLYFLTHKWELSDESDEITAGTFRADNFNFYKGRPFKNVLELRDYKMRNYMHMSSLVKNYLLVRYEDIAKDPEGFIKFISTSYALKNQSSFIPITSYKGDGEVKYQPKQHFKPSKEALKYINQKMNWKVEEKLGYSLSSSI